MGLSKNASDMGRGGERMWLRCKPGASGLPWSLDVSGEWSGGTSRVNADASGDGKDGKASYKGRSGAKIPRYFSELSLAQRVAESRALTAA